MLCEAFTKWKEGLVKPKSGEEPEEENGETPELTDKLQEPAEEETPEVTNGHDEEEVTEAPAQEVQAVRKKEATKEILCFGYPRNS